MRAVKVVLVAGSLMVLMSGCSHQVSQTSSSDPYSGRTNQQVVVNPDGSQTTTTSVTTPPPNQAGMNPADAPYQEQPDRGVHIRSKFVNLDVGDGHSVSLNAPAVNLQKTPGHGLQLQVNVPHDDYDTADGNRLYRPQ